MFFSVFLCFFFVFLRPGVTRECQGVSASAGKAAGSVFGGFCAKKAEASWGGEGSCSICGARKGRPFVLAFLVI